MDFNLKSIGNALAEIGLPILGAALPIPGGAALGKLLAGKLTGNSNASTQDVLLALGTPEGLAEARKFELTHEETILRINTEHDIAMRKEETLQVQSVNTTMQAEASAANWPTYTWRPFLGFISGVMILGNYFLLPLFGKQSVIVPMEAWMFLSAVLGLASHGHSKALADPTNTAVTRG
jgi:hypothetical protein